VGTRDWGDSSNNQHPAAFHKLLLRLLLPFGHGSVCASILAWLPGTTLLAHAGDGRQLPQWQRVAPTTSRNGGQMAEKWTRKRYGSPCWTASRAESDYRRRVCWCWVRARRRRGQSHPGVDANANQAARPRPSASFWNPSRQIRPAIEGRQTVGASRRLRISLRWATPIKTYLIPTMKVRDMSNTHHQEANPPRYPRPPLALPPRKPLARLYTPHKTVSEPSHPPAHARRNTPGLEPPLAMDTAASRLDTSPPLPHSLARRCVQDGAGGEYRHTAGQRTKCWRL
jgi:hypothetical protein